MKQAIWVSFDLGVRGDYESIYAWLDEHGAIECGDSLAYLKYEFNNDLIAEFTQDILTTIEITKKTRIYVIWQDAEKKTPKGRFVFGGRKSPPWSGYANGTKQVEPDES
jgi:hypothetical protein